MYIACYVRRASTFLSCPFPMRHTPLAAVAQLVKRGAQRAVVSYPDRNTFLHSSAMKLLNSIILEPIDNWDPHCRQ